MIVDIGFLNMGSILELVNPRRVKLPNGDMSLVIHTGSISISNNSTI